MATYIGSTGITNAYIGIQNPQSIVLDKNSISLNTAGDTYQLTATIEPTVSDKTVTWSSDDITVATVSTTGLVTCVTPWRCTITATTVNGLTASCNVGTSRLPAGYQEVEWIENTGNCWINTGLSNWIGYKIDLKFYTSSSSPSDQTILWWAGTSNTDPIYLWINYWQWQFFIWVNGNWINVMSGSTGSTYEVTTNFQNWNQQVIINGNTVYSAGASISGTGSYNLAIFSRRGSNYAKIKLYEMQVYNSTDTLIRNFVPCYRIADTEIWLYDLENDVFYTNAGSGTFVKGNDV